MVNNIGGLSGVTSSAGRNREQTPANEQADSRATNNDATNNNTAPAATDKVDLSSSARDLQNIEARLQSLPDVNAERVAQIKQAVDDGSYTVDPARLAASIVKFEEDL